MGNEKNPKFELSYGTTGESFALEAARRCRPSLPDDVIDRAAELMNGDDGDAADSLRQYLSALELERQNIREVTRDTDETWKEVCEYKSDMVSKIQTSRMHLSRLESRLESIYDNLKKDETGDTFELIGNSLEEIRLLKRKVQTEEEQLAEKGLRRVTNSYAFSSGEMVVIIAEGEWKGYDAVVKAVDDPLTVMVVPVLDMFSINEDDAEDALIFRRSDIAVYDYPNWGFADDNYVGTSSDSERKESSNVLRVLSNLDTSKSKAITTNTSAKTKGQSFTSARQRKAAAAAAKGAANQKKGRNKGKKKR